MMMGNTKGSATRTCVATAPPKYALNKMAATKEVCRDQEQNRDGNFNDAESEHHVFVPAELTKHLGFTFPLRELACRAGRNQEHRQQDAYAPNLQFSFSTFFDLLPKMNKAMSNRLKGS